MNQACVSLEEVFAAAGARAASLVPETSGYLTLAVADATSRLPYVHDDRAVLLTIDGSVMVPRKGALTAPPEAARGLREVLRRLLAASKGSMPGLVSAARARAAEQDVDRVVSDVEAALIPVNRSAAKRALARLARETLRAKEMGKLRSKPAQEAAPRQAAAVSVQAAAVVAQVTVPAQAVAMVPAQTVATVPVQAVAMVRAQAAAAAVAEVAVVAPAPRAPEQGGERTSGGRAPSTPMSVTLSSAPGLTDFVDVVRPMVAASATPAPPAMVLVPSVVAAIETPPPPAMVAAPTVAAPAVLETAIMLDIAATPAPAPIAWAPRREIPPPALVVAPSPIEVAPTALTTSPAPAAVAQATALTPAAVAQATALAPTAPLAGAATTALSPAAPEPTPIDVELVVAWADERDASDPFDAAWHDGEATIADPDAMAVFEGHEDSFTRPWQASVAPVELAPEGAPATLAAAATPAPVAARAPAHESPFSEPAPTRADRLLDAFHAEDAGEVALLAAASSLRAFAGIDLATPAPRTPAPRAALRSAPPLSRRASIALPDIDDELPLPAPRLKNPPGARWPLALFALGLLALTAAWLYRPTLAHDFFGLRQLLAPAPAPAIDAAPVVSAQPAPAPSVEAKPARNRDARASEASSDGSHRRRD